tara:strand:+ start:14319 stop:14621 length:303 start_codon:yes stop_codon:yes gene_type:complete
MILVKIHQDQRKKERQVFAICDSNLIGKTLEQGDIKIEITERFYKGIEFPEEEIVDFMREGANLNIVGEESMQLALKNKILEPDSIRKIQGVPIAFICNF